MGEAARFFGNYVYKSIGDVASNKMLKQVQDDIKISLKLNDGWKIAKDYLW